MGHYPKMALGKLALIHAYWDSLGMYWAHAARLEAGVLSL